MSFLEECSDNFTIALRAQIESRIKQFAVQTAEKMIEEYRTELRKRMADICSSMCVEIFKMIEFNYEKNRLVISIQGLGEK